MAGKLVSRSGYEDTICQVELCTTGSKKRIHLGGHCNKTWLVNECFAKAIDCLFCEKYRKLEKPPHVKTDMVTQIWLLF